MSIQKLVTVSLLLFVGVTIGVVVTKGFRSPVPAEPADSKEVASGEAASANSAANGLREGLIAYYFHSDTRCPTCRTIEAFAEEAIAEQFQEELASGEVQWRVLNYEQPDSQAQVERYQIIAPTVVLSKIEEGAETSWTSLDKVWQLTHEKAEFIDYVQAEASKLQPKRGG